MCSVVSDSMTPWTVARKAPLSMKFSRQEHWSGLPFPTPIYVFIPQKSIAKCSNRIIITDVGLIIFKFYLFLYKKSPIVHINFYIKDQ